MPMLPGWSVEHWRRNVVLVVVLTSAVEEREELEGRREVVLRV